MPLNLSSRVLFILLQFLIITFVFLLIAGSSATDLSRLL